MSLRTCTPSPLRLPRPSRAVPGWSCAAAALVLALVLLCMPSAAASADDLGATPAAALDVHDAAVAIDDDSGDDADAPSPDTAPVRDAGAPLASIAPRAETAGTDPPRVPPPEA